MKRYVLDSFALLAYYENEAAGPAVAELFKQALDKQAELFLCVVNWGEMYYIALREAGRKQAEQYLKVLASLPVKIISADQALTSDAAQIKAANPISYADAFAAALAIKLGAALVTGDPDFKKLQSKIEIVWLSQEKAKR